jgi:hypothetical protein
LFIFCQHRQLPMVAQFFKGYASPEVTRPREVATDPTFLTGFFFSLLGPVKHPQMHPKKYTKVLKRAGCMAQCLNLKISSKLIISNILLGEMVQDSKNTGFYAVYSPCWCHLGTPK